MKCIIAYIPVLHRGYLDFFARHSDVDMLFILGEDILRVFPELDYINRKDVLRALSAREIVCVIQALNVVKSVGVLRIEDIGLIFTDSDCIVVPDEDVTHLVAEKYLKNTEIIFDSVFLRWNRRNVEKESDIKPDRKITITDFDKECMVRAFNEGKKSSDWWIQVGGVVVKDGEVLLWAHNSHLPFPEMPYVFGDPRSMFKSGIRIELSTASHVERVLVAEAVRRGVSFLGANLYITDFPCPPCALALARTGLKCLYYTKGSYSMLNGRNVLRSNDIEVVHVSIE